MEGWGDQKWRPNQEKTYRKQVKTLKRKIIPKPSQNGCQLEPKMSQKGIHKSMFFWLGFRMPPETLAELRRGGEEAAGVAATVTLSPADPPGRRHIIKEYCTITSKDRIA